VPHETILAVLSGGPDMTIEFVVLLATEIPTPTEWRAEVLARHAEKKRQAM